MLEEEIARLREENRALVNSILGLAGIPPVPRRSRAFVGADLRRPAAPSAIETPPSADAAHTKTDSARTVDAARSEGGVPLRRRSWQQLGRVREIEDARAARRERETDTATFPAPRNVVPRI